jgi:osmotically-inducible protein OsmY
LLTVQWPNGRREDGLRGTVRKSKQALGLGWLVPTLLLAGACAPSTLPIGMAGDGERTVVADGSAAAAVDDSTITLELNQRLIEYGAGLFKDVRTVVFEGRALLLGRVGDRAARQEATAVAASTEFVEAVINEIHVGDESGVGTFLNDVAIEKTITDNYDLDQSIQAAHYRVRAVEGIVYLIGRAMDEGELQRALAVAGETDNVKWVVNHITVGAR